MLVNYPSVNILISDGRGGFLTPAVDIYCESISKAAGLQGGYSAQFSVPSADTDSLNGLMLRVDIDGKTEFAGFARDDSFQFDPTLKRYTFQATDSASFILQHVFCGQIGHTVVTVGDDNIPVATRQAMPSNSIYPAVVTGRRCGLIQAWRPKAIIEDLYSWLPDEVKTAVKLGDTTELRFIGDFAKRNAPQTYDFSQGVKVADAMQQIADIYGDITICVRFQSGTAYLDFKRVSKFDRTERIKIPDGASYQNVKQAVSNINFVTSKEDYKDRYIIRGNPQKKCITLTDLNAFGEYLPSYAPELALTPDWTVQYVAVERSYYREDTKSLYQWVEEITNEQYVLEFGKASQDPKSEFFRSECEFVFRRYRLPSYFTHNKSLKFSEDYYVKSSDETGYKCLSGQALIQAYDARSDALEDRIATLQKAGWLFTAQGLPDSLMFGGGMPIPRTTIDQAGGLKQSNYCYYYGNVVNIPPDHPGFLDPTDSNDIIQYMLSPGATVPINAKSLTIWAVDETVAGTNYKYSTVEVGTGGDVVPKNVRAVSYKIVGDSVLLSEPAVREVMTSATGKISRTFWTQAPIMVNITVENTSLPIQYDTGLVKNTIDGYDILSATCGMTELQVGDYSHITHEFFAFYMDRDDSVADVDPPVVNEMGKSLFAYIPASDVIYSELTAMKTIADQQLAYLKKVAVSADFEQPIIARMDVGTGIILTGNVPKTHANKPLFASQITLNLRGFSTSITAQNKTGDLQTWTY